MLKIFLIIFFFAFLYKLVRNLSRFIRIKILYKYYYSLCTPNTNPKVWETKQETINLFKIAGIKDSSIPVSKKIWSGYISAFKASLFDNYPNNRSDFAPHYFSMFDEAKGIFKYRIFECFNPFYWLDLIIFAPKNILNYIGVSSEERSTKILNVVLTFMYWIFGIFITVLKDKIQAFILSYFP